MHRIEIEKPFVDGDEYPLDLSDGFHSFADGVIKERADRLESAKNPLAFGIKFLADAFGGIYKNDLILIGSKTGLGKSQLAILIALENAKLKKRVHFFALEADRFEIERRVKYQKICDYFYSDPNRPPINLNYAGWYRCEFDNELREIEERVESERHEYETLNIFYRENEFGGTEFQKTFLAIKDETDLVILDHFHYFDFDDDNENRAMKDTVKKIRDCVLLTGKPVILIAHIRKTDRRMKALVPDIEDFHGSSDISKIATKAFTIAPCYDMKLNTHRHTFFSLLKCRIDGARSRYVGLLAFNLAEHRYEREYYIGRLVKSDSVFEPFEVGEHPFWAYSAQAAPREE